MSARVLVGALALLAVAVWTPVAADEPPLQWIKGPATASLGDDVAQVRIDEGYAFVGAADARRLLESMGNPTSGNEMGIVVPRGEGDRWFAVFQYHAVGYVRDDERDHIDAAAILESIRKGTEDANAYRKEHGIPALHTVGWMEAPHYDTVTHNLTWATLAKDENGQTVANHNVRLLGRSGYTSVTLVEDPEKLAAAKPGFDGVLAGFAYRRGKSYAEYVTGDRVAQFGLTALVAGGAGAAAMKLGLFGKLAKFLAAGWKLVVAGFVALAAMVRRLLAALTKRRRQPEVVAGPDPESGGAAG